MSLVGVGTYEKNLRPTQNRTLAGMDPLPYSHQEIHLPYFCGTWQRILEFFGWNWCLVQSWISLASIKSFDRRKFLWRIQTQPRYFPLWWPSSLQFDRQEKIWYCSQILTQKSSLIMLWFLRSCLRLFEVFWHCLWYFESVPLHT